MFKTSDRSRSTHVVPLKNLAAILIVPLTVACGDSGSREANRSADPRETSAERDLGGLDSTRVRLNAPWSRNRTSNEPDPDAEPVRLTAVTMEELTDYDRVIFTFEERVPGYRLAFVTGGGGGCDGTEPVGDAPAHLAVEFEPAVSNDGGIPLVEDRDRETRFPALVGATQSCDDGRKVRWLLAMRGETDYRFLVMVGKPRLVVDLRHP